VGVAIPALFVTLLPRAIASKSDGVSRNSTALIDIDGDGYPDYVRENGPNELKVRRNLTGRTNLLKDVTLPFGGHIALTYEKTLPGFALPGSRYVLKSVETTGGYAENGATKMRNEFEYEGGYRDRRERDFYGFEKVITKQIDTQNGNAVYRKQVEEYGHNRDFYMHDLVTAETLYDAEGNKLQGTQNTYELKQQTDTTVYFPALVYVKQTIYDNNGSGSMSTTVNNSYDAYGNLISYKETATNYELDADIAYHDLQAKYTEQLVTVKYLHLSAKTTHNLLKMLYNVPLKTLEEHSELYVKMALIKVKMKQFHIKGNLDVTTLIHSLENLHNEQELDNLFKASTIQQETQTA